MAWDTNKEIQKLLANAFKIRYGITFKVVIPNFSILANYFLDYI